MNIKYLVSAIAIVAALAPCAPIAATPLPGICDVLGNAPIGGDTVNTVATTAGEAGVRQGVSFEPEVQSKVNAAGAALDAASLSGSQTVGGATVTVDPQVAQTAVETIGSPVGANTPAVTAFATALGGSEAAQKLAQSMQGLRRGDGSIDPTILNNAVDSYNTYIKSLVDSSQITQKPTTELDRYIQSLPAGQKVAQAILGKLTEAAK